MRRGQLIFLTAAAGVMIFVALVLIRVEADQQAALSAIQARLAELRAQHLDPRDIDKMQRVIGNGHDPREGLLIADDSEAISYLDEFIRSVARVHEAEVISITLTLDSANATLPIIRGDLHLTVSDENIGFFIRALETGPPAVFMERARIVNERGTEANGGPLMLDLVASILVYRGNPLVKGSTP